jgi:hypothetical protein
MPLTSNGHSIGCVKFIGALLTHALTVLGGLRPWLLVIFAAFFFAFRCSHTCASMSVSIRWRFLLATGISVTWRC